MSAPDPAALDLHFATPDESPYAPTVHVTLQQRRLATLYWDDAPAMPDGPEDATGWVWFSSDDPANHDVITTQHPQTLEVALEQIQRDVSARLERAGPWEPRPLPWSRIDADPPEVRPAVDDRPPRPAIRTPTYRRIAGTPRRRTEGNGTQPAAPNWRGHRLTTLTDAKTGMPVAWFLGPDGEDPAR